MKKIIGSFLIVISLLIASCSKVDENQEENTITETNYSAQYPSVNSPKFSKTALVVQFKKNTPSRRRFALRQQFQEIGRAHV